MKTITIKDVVESTEKIVKGKAGFVYPRASASWKVAGNCTYVYRNRPDCLIGRILADQGVPVETLKKLDTALEGSSVSFDSMDSLNILRKAKFKFDDKAVDAMATMQAEQDMGNPWGECRATAREALTTSS